MTLPALFLLNLFFWFSCFVFAIGKENYTKTQLCISVSLDVLFLLIVVGILIYAQHYYVPFSF